MHDSLTLLALLSIHGAIREMEQIEAASIEEGWQLGLQE